MADTSAGFRYRGRKCGQPPTIQKITMKDTEVLTKGDLINLETGLADLAATDDAYIVGVVCETVSGTTAVTKVSVIVDEDAVYGVYDASARLKGAALDIAGATGAQTVAADSNHDLRVFANSSAAEETLVTIIHGAHPDTLQKT